MIKTTGMILALGIGASCRWFDIPLPRPPSLVGTFLIVGHHHGLCGCGQVDDDLGLKIKNGRVEAWSRSDN